MAEASQNQTGSGTGPPSRRLRFTLTGHADTLRDVSSALYDLCLDVTEHAQNWSTTSGGASSGYTFRVEVTDPEQTADRYQEQLRAFIASEHAQLTEHAAQLTEETTRGD